MALEAETEALRLRRRSRALLQRMRELGLHEDENIMDLEKYEPLEGV
jgi:hypothetical protein